MINSFDEIQDRFDKIKDHKPKATKKLSELGDILASAYKISPETADEMWQYIIDLNVSEDITNSDFYIAQVFNKLISHLSVSSLTDFVSMNPERVYNLIVYGYNGTKTWNVRLWECLEILIPGYIEMNRIDEAALCINWFYERFGGIWSDRKEIYRVARRVTNTCVRYYINNDNCVDEAESLLNIIGQTENSEVNAIVEITKIISSSDVCEDYDMLFYLTRKCKEPVEFFDLLWESRKHFTMDDLRTKWIEYVSECDDQDIRPWNYIHDNEKLKFYVDLEKDEDELLDYYFNRAKLYDVERGIVYSWVENRDWERFIKYISQSIISTREPSIDLTLKNLLANLKSACCSANNRHVANEYRYGDITIDKNQIESFSMSLAKISAITLGCECHDDYHTLIKEFVIKNNKNAFKEIGYPEETEQKSKKSSQDPEKQLKNYVNNFLAKGETLHKKCDIHDKIIEQLQLHDYSPKATNKAYRLAHDNVVAEFYFSYAIRENEIRKTLISSCVKKNDLEHVLKLIDMMISTKDKTNYRGTAGWGHQNALTIIHLIREYDYSLKGSNRVSEINDEKRQLVKQLVERITPYLPEKSQEKVKDEIYRITPIEDSFEAYVANLLENVDIYTEEISSKKSVNVNSLSNQLEKSFSKCASKDRYDIIYHIMMKLAKNEKEYNSIKYPMWMWRLIRGVSERDLMKLFKNYPEIFIAWVEHPSVKDSDIREIAEIFGGFCSKDDFLAFRNLVLNHKGFIDGVDNCFKRTSKNTETQVLFDGTNALIELDYLEVYGYCPRASFNPICNVVFHFLTMQKSKKLNSVRVVSCKVNDLDVNSLGFVCGFDDGGPSVGYELYQRKSKDELTIYGDFFDNKQITHIRKIELALVLMDENKKVLETPPTIIIEYDIYAGDYKVV